MDEIIVDVRSRYEFLKNHVKGAINIPLYDMELYESFLKGLCSQKSVAVYCGTEHRAKIAKKKLDKMEIKARVITTEELRDHPWEGKDVVCAMNFVEVRPGHEEKFEKSVKELCRATEEFPGFLGSQLLRISGVSAIGSGLPGEMRDLEFKPLKYVILTYWESKEIHDKSHLEDVFIEAFKEMPVHLVKMPYEEFYEVLR